MSKSVQVFAQVPAARRFGCKPGSGVAGSSCTSVSNFLRNHQVGFQSSCTSLRSQQCARVPTFPYPHQHLLFSVFNDNHPNGREVVCYGGLGLHLPPRFLHPDLSSCLRKGSKAMLWSLPCSLACCQCPHVYMTSHGAVSFSCFHYTCDT